MKRVIFRSYRGSYSNMEFGESLREVGFKERYKRRQGHQMLQEFYIPMLKSSSTYDRVAGYFSSSVIKHASAGFAKFCENPNIRERDSLPKFCESGACVFDDT